MVKKIQDCPRCGGNVVERIHPRYGQYAVCVQCGHDGRTVEPPREMLTGQQGADEMEYDRILPVWKGKM